MKNILATFIVAVAMVVPIFFAPAAGAVDIYQSCSGSTGSNSTLCKSTGDSANTLIGNIINILLTVATVVSVIVIIIGGIMYATSNGDSGRVTNAKNTVLYAVIGLVVSGFALAIVNLVVARMGLN